jgi:hypothetical protein
MIAVGIGPYAFSPIITISNPGVQPTMPIVCSGTICVTQPTAASSGSSSSSSGGACSTPFACLYPLAGAATDCGDLNDGTGAQAKFSNMTQIVYDGVGSIFVADNNNGAIRNVTIPGAVTTTPFNSNQNSSPLGVAYDGTGNLYWTDESSDNVNVLTIPGDTNNQFAGGSWDQVQGLTIDVPNGNLYVADESDRIWKVTIPGALTSVFAGLPGAPFGIAYDGAGTLYSTGPCSIYKTVISGPTTTVLAGNDSSCGSMNGTGTAAQFEAPQGLAYDGSGNLYVADTGNGLIRKIVVSTGFVSTVLGVAGQFGFISSPTPVASAQIGEPQGITWAGSSTLIIADSDNCVLYSWH